jgi:hypothetical protein
VKDDAMEIEESRDHGGGSSVALMLGLSPLFLGPCLVFVGALFPWSWPLCFAYFSGMVCVLAIWLAISNRSLCLRVPLAMLPGTALGLVIFGLGYPNMPERERMIEIAVFALLVPAASLPSFGLRALRYRLVLPWNQQESEPASDANPFQFSLRQLFGLTAAVALYAFVARLLADNDAHQSDVNGAQIIIFVVLSLSAAGAAWATLGRRDVFIRLLLVAATSGSIVFLMSVHFAEHTLSLLFASGWAALHPLVVGAALGLFREIGYRLIRMPPTENTRPKTSGV